MLILILILIFLIKCNSLIPIEYPSNIQIVKSITNFLPKVDLVGHQVLISNGKLIPQILDINSNILNDDIKKEIILTIIKSSQLGDNMGNLILENYHTIVEKLL